MTKDNKFHNINSFVKIVNNFYFYSLSKKKNKKMVQLIYNHFLPQIINPIPNFVKNSPLCRLISS